MLDISTIVDTINKSVETLALSILDVTDNSALFVDDETNASLGLQVSDTIHCELQSRFIEDVSGDFNTAIAVISWYEVHNSRIVKAMSKSDKVSYKSILDSLREENSVNLELYDAACSIYSLFDNATIISSNKHAYEIEFGNDSLFLYYDENTKNYVVNFYRNDKSYLTMNFSNTKTLLRLWQTTLVPEDMTLRDLAIEFIKNIRYARISDVKNNRATIEVGSTSVITLSKFLDRWLCVADNCSENKVIPFKDAKDCLTKLKEEGLV